MHREYLPQKLPRLNANREVAVKLSPPHTGTLHKNELLFY